MASSKTHVLFDFFGTLVSYSASRTEQGYPRTHGVVQSAGAALNTQHFLELWDEVAGEFESIALRTLDEYSMDSVCEEFLRRALRREPEQGLVKKFRDSYLEEWSTGVRYLSEVPHLLAQLSQSSVLALITNTHHAELVETHLNRMNVRHHFSAVVTSVEHGRRKPDPSIFSRTLNLTGGTAERSIYLGDSYAADYSGARAAGIDCLLIDPTHQHDVPPEARINHLGEVLTRLSVGN